MVRLKRLFLFSILSSTIIFSNSFKILGAFVLPINFETREIDIRHFKLFQHLENYYEIDYKYFYLSIHNNPDLTVHGKLNTSDSWTTDSKRKHYPDYDINLTFPNLHRYSYGFYNYGLVSIESRDLKKLNVPDLQTLIDNNTDYISFDSNGKFNLYLSYYSQSLLNIYYKTGNSDFVKLNLNDSNVISSIDDYHPFNYGDRDEMFRHNLIVKDLPKDTVFKIYFEDNPSPISIKFKPIYFGTGDDMLNDEYIKYGFEAMLPRVNISNLVEDINNTNDFINDDVTNNMNVVNDNVNTIITKNDISKVNSIDVSVRNGLYLTNTYGLNVNRVGYGRYTLSSGFNFFGSLFDIFSRRFNFITTYSSAFLTFGFIAYILGGKRRN